MQYAISSPGREEERSGFLLEKKKRIRSIKNFPTRKSVSLQYHQSARVAAVDMIVVVRLNYCGANPMRAKWI